MALKVLSYQILYHTRFHAFPHRWNKVTSRLNESLLQIPETTEQKLASPVVITPSTPTESQPVIETVSYTVCAIEMIK